MLMETSPGSDFVICYHGFEIKMRSLFPVIFLILLGCSSEESKESVKRELAPEEKAEIQAEIEREKQQRREEELALRNALTSASDEKLYEVLGNCRGRVKEEADGDNSGPFGYFLVDEYSADSYLYAAGYAAESFEDRVKTLRSSLSSEISDYFSFNTEFAVIFTSDSFSGPQREVFKYSCDIDSGLKVVAVNKPFSLRYRR